MKQFFFFTLAALLSQTALSQVPTISSFSPIAASKGASVVITGTNFDATQSNNIVYFGATQAPVTGASLTSLTVTVPGGASCGPISVITNNNIAYSTLSFVTSYSYCGSPEINALSWETGFPIGGSTQSAIIGDVDGDGKPEIIKYINHGTFGDSLFIQKNTTTTGVINSSSFSAQVGFAIGVDNNSKIILRDVDVDGKLDLIISARRATKTTFSIMRNTSTLGVINAASFAPSVTFTMPNSESPKNIAYGDLDGDGKPELAVTTGGQNGQTSGGTNLVVYKNTSTPGTISVSSFAAPVSYSVVTNGNFLEGLEISDMDGDGKPDVVVASYGNNGGVVIVLRSTSVLGTISFATPVTYTSVGNDMTITLTDLDLDGKTEIICSTPNIMSPFLKVFKNNSTPGVINSTSFVNSYTNSSYSCIIIADGNGDGKPDIIDRYAYVLVNSTTPGTINASSFSPYLGGNPVSSFQTMGDLDGDGMPDIVGTGPDFVSRRTSVLPVTTPDICMVTVDSISINNEIYWNKSLYPTLDSMIIYREVTSNVYKRIGAVSKNVLSMYIDTARSIGPANGNPNVGTYRYKIKVRDNCGNFSALSLWHNTVFFINSSGTFFWNEYKIEGSPTPINPMSQFDLSRDNFAPTEPTII